MQITEKHYYKDSIHTLMSIVDQIASDWWSSVPNLTVKTNETFANVMKRNTVIESV